MFSMTAVPVIQFAFILCLQILVEGKGNIPLCKQSGSKLVGELCFNFNAAQVTWHEARNSCEKNGMTFAYVSSLEQIKEILQGNNIVDQVWIGASDEKNEKNFIWVASNEKATELENIWGEGEPNNKVIDGGDEDCASLFNSFYANDISCNRKFPYLCIEKSCPYNLTVGRIFNNNLSLVWKPGFNGGLPREFTIKYQDLTTNISLVAGRVAVPRVNQTASTAIEYSLSGLSTKTAYKIDVESSSNNGKTLCPSLVVTSKTTGPPECPVNVTIDEVANDRVSLSWTPGQKDELPQSFNILARNMSVSMDVAAESAPIGKAHTSNYTRVMYTAANLSELANYTFTFDVENNFGIRKCDHVNVQVQTTSACPYNLKVGKIFNNNLTLFWEPGFDGSRPQTFNVTYQELGTKVIGVSGTITDRRVGHMNSGGIEYTVIGLSAKTPYKLYIDASNDKRKTTCAPLTVTFETTGPPECPLNVTIDEVANDRVSLSWTPGRKDELPQSFNILARTKSVSMDVAAESANIGQAHTSNYTRVMYTAAHLSEFTNYTFTFDVVNNFGIRKCDQVSVQVQTTSGPPECPVNITIDEVANDRVSISWTPDQEDELSQTFTILAHNVSVFKNIPIESVPVGRLSSNNYKRVMYTVENLSESTHYTFSVEVENNFGLRKCKDNLVKVTTTSGLQTRSFPTWLIFLLIFTLLALALVIVGFVWKMRKPNRTLNMENQIPMTH